VLGDTTHGKGRLNALYRTRYGLTRLFLHAHRIALLHPRSGEPLLLVDPLPAELEAVLQRLRADSGPRGLDCA
jgi:23S rRNA-/tRNA-specific pseudouridylate synthase